MQIYRFKAGIVRGPAPQKRKREDGEEETVVGDAAESSGEDDDEKQAGSPQKTKKKKVYGQKGPNPLAVKKAKKEGAPGEKKHPREMDESKTDAAGETPGESKPKRKRRKKAGTATVEAAGEGHEVETAGAEVTATADE